MYIRGATRGVSLLLLLILGFAASCDLGSALLTDDEIGEMYDIGILDGKAALSDGSEVAASRSLSLEVAALDGAPEPESLVVELLDAEGKPVASVTYGPDAGADGADFLSDLPPFALPADLADGYYVLSATLKDAAGAVLTTWSVTVLSLGEPLAAPVVAVFPGTVRAGGTAFLKLEWDLPEGLDPWIRWSVDGKALAEGYASGKADRLAWPVPGSDGVHSAVAEVFPFRPPEGSSVPPRSKAVARVPVSAATASPDPWSGLDTWSLLTLDGTFEDSGPRPDFQAPAALGSPYLESYGAGFGFALGGGSGVRSDEPLLPLDPETGRPVDFAIALLVAPYAAEAGGGTLYRSAAADGRTAFAFGLSDGVPYAESLGVKAFAEKALQGGPVRLAVRVRKSGPIAAVDFYIDDIHAGSGRLPSAVFDALPGASTLAGEGGYRAVYDELRTLRGAYPAFAVAKSFEAGAGLIAASGFEGGSLGKGLSVSGDGATAGDGWLALEKGAVLTVGEGGLPREGAALAVTLSSGSALASLLLSDGSLLSVDSAGNISIGSIYLVGALDMGGEGRLVVSYKAVDDGLDLYGAGGEAIRIPSASPEGSAWRVSPLSEGKAVLDSALATRFVPPQPSIGEAPTRDRGSTDTGEGLRVSMAGSIE